MGKTNWKRVFLGGVVAGVVLSVIYYAIQAFFGGRIYFSTILTAAYFIAGIMVIWLYSAIRPRYGAGPMTAIIAGIALYVLSELLPAISSMNIVYRTQAVMNKGIIFLVMYVPATLAGAWIYKEQP